MECKTRKLITMQTKSFLRMALVATLALGLSVSAQAQLKGVLNKAKKAVKDKAEKVVDETLNQTKKKAAETAKSTANSVGDKAEEAGIKLPVALSSGPETPKIMAMDETRSDYDATGKYINEVAWGLRKTSLAEAKALADKLNTRAKWVNQTLSDIESGKVAADAELTLNLRKELGNWAAFYSKLGSIMNLMNFVTYQKDDNGLFFYQGTPMFMCGVHVSGIEASESGVKRGKSLIFTRKDNKSFFCSSSMEPIVADEEDIRVAKLDYNMALNIAAMFEGYPLEWCRQTRRGVEKDTYDIYYHKALSYHSTLKDAIAGNSVDNLVFKPMPKAGSLNASLKAKALQLQKVKNKDCVDVVIVSNSWEVQKNSLGTPVRRVVYGYSISKTKHGNMATRVSWAEDYKSGKYGALHAYGVGMESFYVK